jgi:hypothetical protein
VGYTASYFYHDKVLKTIGYVNEHTFLIRSSFLPIVMVSHRDTCECVAACCEAHSETLLFWRSGRN